jgi:hypothetical protein
MNLKSRDSKILERLTVCLILFFFTTCSYSQEEFVDVQTRKLFDSLDLRISYLEGKIPKISANRDANYFVTRRELDMTIFLKQYQQYIFDEKLEEAQNLIEQKIKSSEKRADKFAVDYYQSYQTKLTRLRGQKRGYYQQLFEKEKNFKKEYEKYIKVGDEYSLQRALRVVELALKYAREQNLTTTIVYLEKYKKYTQALLFDLNSTYDLRKLTGSKRYYSRVVTPMLENDTLSVIQAAAGLIEQCYNYSRAAESKVDTNFLALQRIAAANYIADWNEREGLSKELASLTGQAIIIRLDSLNREGIYRWNDLIVVIGTVKFNSKSDNVQRGEAILDADHTLMNYVRVNKLTNQDLKKAKIGKTFMLSYKDEGNNTFFKFDQNKQMYQYMIAYSEVISKQVTEEIRRFLPPLQFNEKVNYKVN